jgi:hypothetical protein
LWDGWRRNKTKKGQGQKLVAAGLLLVNLRTPASYVFPFFHRKLRWHFKENKEHSTNYSSTN